MIGLWRVLCAVLSPLLALVAWAHPRLRVGLRERIGFPEAAVEPGAVWVHAASLGEGRAAAAFVAAVRAARPELEIVRTWTSAAAAGQVTGVDQSLAAPLDAPVFVGAWLDRMRPRCLVLVEAELWPCLLAACRRRRIPVVVVNARVGPGFRRWRASGVWRALTRDVLFVAPDAPTAALLGGAVTGDLKAEAPLPPPAFGWARTAVVAGSTHPGEEAMLLDAVRPLDPRPLLVLAPRDPGRFDGVAELLDERGERWTRRTRLRGDVPEGVDVVLLDTLGELAGLYPAAAAAFVGGTFRREVGGHSPAEARAAGLPVVTGPYTQANPAAWEGVRAFHAVSPASLGSALTAALAAGRVPVAGAAAAVATVELVAPVLAAPVPAERWVRPWLLPLVPLWWAGVRLRRGEPVAAPVPVVVVGALTAGGTGKTPVAAWLAGRLAARTPVVVARGYGRDAGRDVRLEGEAGDLGDELAMLARRGIRVASSPDRLAAIRGAVEAGAGLAILDDALMVPTVRADLTVIVVDARWPGGGGPIPVGTARLGPRALARADVVWVNHGPLPEELRAYVRRDAVVVEARYRPVGWVFRGELRPLDALPDRPAVAFAGVARPQGFFRILRRLGVPVVRTGIFRDHHRFRWADLQNIEAWLDDHVVVTTEKDAARLPRDAGVHALRVEVEVVTGGEALERRLEGLRGPA